MKIWTRRLFQLIRYQTVNTMADSRHRLSSSESALSSDRSVWWHMCPARRPAPPVSARPSRRGLAPGAALRKLRMIHKCHPRPLEIRSGLVGRVLIWQAAAEVGLVAVPEAGRGGPRARVMCMCCSTTVPTRGACSQRKRQGQGARTRHVHVLLHNRADEAQLGVQEDLQHQHDRARAPHERSQRQQRAHGLADRADGRVEQHAQRVSLVQFALVPLRGRVARRRPPVRCGAGRPAHALWQGRCGRPGTALHRGLCGRRSTQHSTLACNQPGALPWRQGHEDDEALGMAGGRAPCAPRRQISSPRRGPPR